MNLCMDEYVRIHMYVCACVYIYVKGESCCQAQTATFR